MSVITEGKHSHEFLVSLANGTRSIATGTVEAGQNLVAGQLVQLNSTKLNAKDANTNTAGDTLSTAVEGIILVNVDATSTGPEGNTDFTGIPYIKRDAEVNQDELTFPSGDDTDETAKALCITALASAGIIMR